MGEIETWKRTDQDWPASVGLHLPVHPEPEVVRPTASDGGDDDRERGNDLECQEAQNACRVRKISSMPDTRKGRTDAAEP